MTTNNAEINIKAYPGYSTNMKDIALSEILLEGIYWEYVFTEWILIYRIECRRLKQINPSKGQLSKLFSSLKPILYNNSLDFMRWVFYLLFQSTNWKPQDDQ